MTKAFMKPTKNLLLELAAERPVSAQVERVNGATDRMAAYLREQGVATVVEQCGERRVLYAATQPGKSTEVLLNAHLDIVPAEEATFQIREENGWLLGRGTHDCLGNAAVAANLLVRLNGKASVGAIFTADEEIGGATARAMVERGYTATRLILVLDGPSYGLAVAQKGIVSVKLIATGRACHAAEPWKGENAIDKLIAGYQKVRVQFPEVRAGDEWHNTMAATIFHAGSAPNRVPETAEMTLNIRFTGERDDARILAEIRRVSGLNTEGAADCQPFIFSGDTPELQALRRVMEERFQRPITVQRMNGATDARHFAKFGVPIAIIGIPGRDAHGADEAIELAALAPFENLLHDFLAARQWAA